MFRRLILKYVLPTIFVFALSGCSAAIPSGVTVSSPKTKVPKDSRKSEGAGGADAVVNPEAIEAGGVGAPEGGAGAPVVEGPDPMAPPEPAAPPPPVMPVAPSTRWIVMGDFGIESLGTIPDCAPGTQQRTVCMGENSRCRSTFTTTCSSPSCRRLFKCVTGQTNSLVWFPMGDGFTTSATRLPLCALGADIAGSACSVVNDRCLSSFCTSGSGSDCGRRTFKCLTSGVEGQFFYRWMGDKPLAEIAGIGQCPVSENIAGTRCFAEESRCVSSFFTDAAQTRRRLFKCTP
ncbi:MAG: hypothetical protein FJY29_08755 [Betaproteobacteria bacterium]|nr:hypothetical protein [Betaproteobacteria bacterium]